MSEEILQDAFVKELLGLLDETFEHTHGFYLDSGSSLIETLDKISASQASRPVSAGGASIAGHVEHLHYYMRLLESEIRKEDFGRVDWNESWELKEVTPTEWESLKGRLRGTCHSVVSAIKGVESWGDGIDIGAPMAILAHTAYHLGAIRQIMSRSG